MASKKKVSDLIPDPKNANRGTERGAQVLEQSLSKYGTGRSILIDKNSRVIAGNKTLETAGSIGIDDVIVVPSDGKKLIAVQRTDLDLETDPAARELAYADNRVGQLNLDWDTEQMTADIDMGFEIPGFTTEELNALFGKVDIPKENKEINEDALAETNTECPKCGFKWKK